MGCEVHRLFLAISVTLLEALLLSTGCTGSKLPYEGPTGWPLPQTQLPLPTYYSLDPRSFKIDTNADNRGNCDVLRFAADHYSKLLFLSDCSLLDENARVNRSHSGQLLHDPNYAGQLNNLTIKIQEQCENWPHANMKEDYELYINTGRYANQAVLLSKNVWGALRGLETFSQLIYSKNGKFYVNHNYIKDYPRFGFRGLLVDTSRHYLSVKTILKNLDAMLYNKLNVFHWHIVDDQSFPFVSKTFPSLSKKGAFLPTHVYTAKDVARVIEYARLRGIRVIAEFDTPGHTLSWGKGQENLLTKCFDKGAATGQYGPIDPTVPENYVFLKQLFSEVARVFPDQSIHLGGDEVDFTCWESNPNITQFMTQKGFGKDYAKLEGYYVQNLVKIVESLNKSYVVWQEVFDNGVRLKPDTVVHVWKGDSKTAYLNELDSVTRRGYRAILSSPWYLSNFKYGHDWEDFYDDDPQAFSGTPKQLDLVIGGEICVWGEYVDGTVSVSRTWPRAAPVAERLWSDKSVTDIDKALPRLEAQRCRMLQRGLHVEPVNGPGYCPCDYAV